MKFEKVWKQRLVQDHPVYAAMIESMDVNVGRILSSSEKLGIEKNTIVIFTSDNGGTSTADGNPTFNGPLKAGKGWLYEGGIWVPLLIRWNEHVNPGTTSGVPVTTADIFTTLAHTINKDYKITKEIDGIDLFALLADPDRSRNRPLYWHYPHYSYQGGKPGSAMLSGDYKLIFHHESKEVELYNLKDDVSEQRDLSKINTKVTEGMNKKLQKWLKDTGATFPEPNPSYSSQ